MLHSLDEIRFHHPVHVYGDRADFSSPYNEFRFITKQGLKVFLAYFLFNLADKKCFGWVIKILATFCTWRHVVGTIFLAFLHI